MKILSARRDWSWTLGFFLFLVVVLIIIFIGAAMPRPGRKFDIGDKIEFMHRPGRVASVTKFWDPDKAAKEFPSGVMGAKGPPYIDGVVEASFVELDAFGREYPKEIAAGTSVAGRRRWVRWGWLVRD